MEGFTQREAAFEKRMELDEALRFKALARRNRRVAMWAADLLGLNGAEGERYVRDFVSSEVGRDDDEALTRQLFAALSPGRPELSEHRILRKLHEERTLASREVFSGD